MPVNELRQSALHVHLGTIEAERYFAALQVRIVPPCRTFAHRLRTGGSGMVADEASRRALVALGNRAMRMVDHVGDRRPGGACQRLQLTVERGRSAKREQAEAHVTCEASGGRTTSNAATITINHQAV